MTHRIGSIVNDNEIYAQKYAKDAEIFFQEAKKSIGDISFNYYERKEIINKIKEELRKELASKEFLREKKFKIMDEEVDKVLKELGLKED